MRVEQIGLLTDRCYLFSLPVVKGMMEWCCYCHFRNVVGVGPTDKATMELHTSPCGHERVINKQYINSGEVTAPNTKGAKSLTARDRFHLD